MNKYRKLLKNSFIFAIGNLGSKLISFILVPFYTYVLTRSQFGTVDIITTTVNMLLPIISLSIFDAVFRFTLDRQENKDVVLTNGVVISVIGSLVTLLLIPVLTLIKVPMPNHVYLLLVTSAFVSLFSNFVRAINQVKSFAFAGILGTLVTAITNVTFLWYLKLGIQGYLISMIIANVAVLIFLSIRIKIFKRFSFDYLDKIVLLKMVTYSVPLIPNAFSWWINTSADRYFILAFVGSAGNGLYAVANKIPSLLTILNQIFFQSWQMSAVEEFNSDDAEKFYSQTFNYYLSVQFLGATALLVILKPLMKIIVSPNYFVAWEYIPFLLLAVIYSSLSGFLGTTYTAAKRTTGIMITTLLGAVINVLIGFLLVPFFGIQGASLAGLFSFGTVLVVRLKNTRKFMNIKVDWTKVVINHLLFIFMVASLFYIHNILILELVLFSFGVLMLMSNYRLINVLFFRLKS